MNIVHIHEADTVVTCLEPLSPGQSVTWGGEDIAVRDAVAVFHKMAVRPMKKGEACLKYGQCIGLATRDIAPGEHVHTHNIESLRGRGDLDK
ncbi:MAG: UxaA family hydrolase [Candidatus Adiutrix sp.]|jgi:altronate dehydratase small subunit|nr:UxaA family hydrolase [Candidatus Adiutrix sp.]